MPVHGGQGKRKILKLTEAVDPKYFSETTKAYVERNTTPPPNKNSLPQPSDNVPPPKANRISFPFPNIPSTFHPASPSPTQANPRHPFQATRAVNKLGPGYKGRARNTRDRSDGDTKPDHPSETAAQQ